MDKDKLEFLATVVFVVFFVGFIMFLVGVAQFFIARPRHVNGKWQMIAGGTILGLLLLAGILVYAKRRHSKKQKFKARVQAAKHSANEDWKPSIAA